MQSHGRKNGIKISFAAPRETPGWFHVCYDGSTGHLMRTDTLPQAVLCALAVAGHSNAAGVVKNIRSAVMEYLDVAFIVRTPGRPAYVECSTSRKVLNRVGLS